MKKKPAKPMPKAKGMTAEDHRKLADKHRARSSLHQAKADLLDIDAPPKASGKGGKTAVGPC